MKRIAFWTILGIIVLRYVVSHQNRSPFYEDRRPPVRSSVVVVHEENDGGRKIIIERRPGATATRLAGPLRSVEPERRGGRVKEQAAKPVAVVAEKRLPDWFPRDADEEAEFAKPDKNGERVFVSKLSSTKDKAVEDSRKTVEREVMQWLAADVPTAWKPPTEAISGMIRESYVQEVPRILGEITKELDGAEVVTIYRAADRVDFSPKRREHLIETFRREQVVDRLTKLGGGLIFSLVCLASLFTYIRTDEATRGYYTTVLRVIVPASIGGAGVLIYHILT